MCLCVCVCVAWFLPVCVVCVCDVWRCVGPHNTVLFSQRFYSWSLWLLCGVQVTLMCIPPSLDAGQSKCRLERAQALEQAKKPQEAVFVPECTEDGSFTQVGLGYSLRPGSWGPGSRRAPRALLPGNRRGLCDTPVPVSPPGPPATRCQRWQWVLKGLCEFEPGNWHCFVPVLPLPVFIVLFCQM